jgi:hypothetical protein
VERGDRRLGKSGSGMWKANAFKAVAPTCVVKDRWVSPREQVLNAPIVCQCYGPGKPSSWLSTEAYLFPHCLIGCCGREAGYGPVDQTAIELWIVSGAFLLGGS